MLYVRAVQGVRCDAQGTAKISYVNLIDPGIADQWAFRWCRIPVEIDQSIGRPQAPTNYL